MKPKSQKKLALVLMVAPLPSLAGILALYAIASFIFASMEGSEALIIVGRVMNLLLSLAGLVVLLGIVFGMPLGLILYILARKREKKAAASHQGEKDQIS